MFGSLQPTLCQIDGEDAAAYRRMYCGTCKALGDEYGLAARPLLSYDVVLFATVIEALRTEPSAESRCRCPLMPLVHRPIVTPASPAMRIAAALQMALTDQWLADQQADGHPTVALARPLTRGRAARAREELAALGLDPRPLQDLSERQVHVEATTRDFVRAAEPTAGLLATIFARIGSLPGSIAEVAPATPGASGLHSLGRNLGLVIYGLDALEDLNEDRRSGAFNPGIDEGGRVSAARVATMGAELERALAAIAHSVARIPWQRYGAVLADVLCQGLPQRVVGALAGARSLAEPAATGRPQAGGVWPDHQQARRGKRRRRKRADTWCCYGCDCCDCCHCCSTRGDGCCSDCCDCCLCDWSP